MAKLTQAIIDDIRTRYAIGDELGGGGMAVVHRARRASDDGVVAIKFLRPEIVRLVGPERFLREIAILRAMNHPRIVPLLDAGAAAGVPYLVMPLIDGPTLRDLIDDTPQGLPLAPVIDLTRDIASAIDYAHARGIMHRDIKPENILLPAGGAIVADFGLARAIEVSGGETLSSSGLILGTAAYMSPEQASAMPVDARTDIYALGCVIYEMLTGEPPFSGASAQAVLARHVGDEPAAIRTVRPDLPDPVERAVMKALDKQPDRRPQHAADLAAMLATDSS